MIKRCVICSGEFEARGSAITCSVKHAKILKRQRTQIHRALHPEYDREWNSANREKLLEQGRIRRAKKRSAKVCACGGNFMGRGKTCSLRCSEERLRERTRKKAAKRRKERPCEVREYNRQWRLQNPKNIRAHRRRWRAENLDKIKTSQRLIYLSRRNVVLTKNRNGTLALLALNRLGITLPHTFKNRRLIAIATLKKLGVKL